MKSIIVFTFILSAFSIPINPFSLISSSSSISFNSYYYNITTMDSEGLCPNPSFYSDEEFSIKFNIEITPGKVIRTTLKELNSVLSNVKTAIKDIGNSIQEYYSSNNYNEVIENAIEKGNQYFNYAKIIAKYYLNKEKLKEIASKVSIKNLYDAGKKIVDYFNDE